MAASSCFSRSAGVCGLANNTRPLRLIAVMAGVMLASCDGDPAKPASQRLECAASVQLAAPAASDPLRKWSVYFASQLRGGFGGWYLLENATVFGFKLVEMDQAPAVVDSLRALLLHSPYAQYASLELRPEPGRYDFLELSGCRDVIPAVIARASMVTAVSIDEKGNQIAIGVATAADSSTAQRTARERYPADLVRIFVQPLITPSRSEPGSIPLP